MDQPLAPEGGKGSEAELSEALPAVVPSLGVMEGPAEDKFHSGDKVPPKGPWVPDRVRTVLEKCNSFEEFRKNRPFRYLHLFSGEKDQLGMSIKAEATRANMEVHVEALDRKRDAELNLASPSVYDEMERSVVNGEWDGFHSGFPCGSFSRVRWRDTPGGPLPVRSAAYIYGLPGNTPKQQREADEGTLMATRSAWLHEKQVEAC